MCMIFSTRQVRLGLALKFLQVVFVSLWYWWKEVMIISFITALFMNVLITRPLLREMRLNFSRRLAHVLRRQQPQQPVSGET